MTVTTAVTRPSLAPEPFAARPPSSRRATVVTLAGWTTLLVVTRLWGLAVVHHAVGDLYLGAVPLFGAWKLLVTWRLGVAALVGAVGVVVLPVLAARLSWRAVLAATAIGAIAWGAALGFAEDPSVAWESIHQDYGQHVDPVDAVGVGGFLRDYTENQATFPTHLQAHPPGFVLMLWASAKLSLEGRGFEVGLSLLGAALAAVAALVVLADVAGRDLARVAAPFVVLVPAAVWHTNADTFYAGVVGVAVAAIVVATGRNGERNTVLAVTGGALFGASLLLSYGVALLALPAVVIAVRRRALRVVGLAAFACAMVLAVPALWGFWWPAGLAATKHQYDLNLARVRPVWYFRFANLAVFALALGPAIAVGLQRLRDRAAWLVVGAGIAVVALADASGLSSGETERIWQPFVPLVALAGCALVGPVRRMAARPWLGLQVATALCLQVALRSPW